MAKEERIGLRATEDEKSFLEMVAERQGCSLSQYVLRAALEKAKEQTPEREHPKS